MKQLKVILGFLPLNFRKKFYLFYFTIILTNFLDVVSIGLFLPTIRFLLNNETGITIIDNFFIQSNFGKNEILIFFLLSIILIFLIKNFLVIQISIFQTKFTSQLSLTLSKTLYEQYLSMPLSYYSKINSATFLRNTNSEVFLFVRYVMSSILLIVSDLTLLIFFSGLLMLVMSFETIIVLLFFLIVALIIYSLNKRKIKDYGNKRAIISENILKFLKEGIESLREIKIYSIKNYFTNRYKEETDKIVPLSIFLNLVNIIPRVAVEVAAVIFFSGLVFFIIQFNYDFTALIPTLSIFLLCVYKISPGTSRLLQNYQTLKHYMPAFYAVKSVYNEHEKIIDLKSKKQNSDFTFKKIVLKNVTFKYKDETILENINFELVKNSKIVISGKSGSGKSTLLDLLTGFISPNSGHIYINDKEVKDSAFDQFLSKTSYIPQTPFFLDSDLVSNIAIGQNEEVKKENINKIAQLLNIVELQEFSENIKKGTNPNLGERGTLISGGQRQRVAIARGLFFNPEILILDEATNSIDEKTELKILENIINNFKNLTIIMVSHSGDDYGDKFKQFEVKDKIITELN